VSAIRLRPATQADAATIGSLHVASWLETYAGILPDEMLAELSVEARTAMWSEALGDPEAAGSMALILAEEDGRPIGFGACGRQRDEALSTAGYDGELGAIYILRSHQDRGVGRSLMAAMARSLSDLGHEAASLWVLRENGRARAFYEALGGKPLGEKTDEWMGETLVEVAYGWSDLSRLAADRGASRPAPER
jgi:GNAT superfamily N-acetyltransferase